MSPMTQPHPIDVGRIMRHSLRGSGPDDPLPTTPAARRPPRAHGSLPGMRDSLALVLHGGARWR
jgi:hypothetical protein